MVFFMTSTPNVVDGDQLNSKNMFVDNLRRYWKPNSRCLMIAASPEAHHENDVMTDYFRRVTANTGFSFSCFDLWDTRRRELAPYEISQYDVIFLSGGHVPTQRKWFRQINLQGLMRFFHGILIGISAGSMNSVGTVYAWPEMPGEAVDPKYELFFPGLGLANTNILPHFQKLRHENVDGRNTVDIARAHSFGRRFYGLPDGSYVLIENRTETVWGEAVQIAEGRVTQFCDDGYYRVIE